MAARGREAAKQIIKDDPKLIKEITKEINKKIKEIELAA